MAFGHENLNAYQKAIEFVVWTGGFVQNVIERAAAKDHLIKAADGIPVGIAEGNSKRSDAWRAQHFGTANGSALECAACLDILVARQLATRDDILPGKAILVPLVSMLVGLRRPRQADRVREGPSPYGGPRFGHEELKVYQAALRFVSWCNGLYELPSTSRNVQDKLDRYSTSIVLNIAEGNGKFPKQDRCRFLDISRTSALKCAAALDVVVARSSLTEKRIEPGRGLLEEVVSMISGLIKYVSGLPE